MADVNRLEQLFQQMAEQNQQMAEQNAKFIAALQANPAQQQPIPQVQQQDVAAIRAEKFSKLYLALHKSGKVKDFKEGQDSSVEDWLKRFDQEVLQLKKMSGIAGDLTREEYIECIWDKLDFRVTKWLETEFPTRNPVLQWVDVTKVQIQQCLIDEFGSKETDVSAVHLQFGPNRCKKTPE